MNEIPHKVLIITGGLIAADETSLVQAIRKWLEQWSNSKQGWLDFKIKLVIAEFLTKMAKSKAGLVFEKGEQAKKVRKFFQHKDFENSPSLTAVVLADLLHREKISYELLTLGELFSNSKKAKALLAATDCVFLSSTYLHDLSELEPILKRVKCSHNRIVLGGALAGILAEQWEGSREVDILAIGYGELLIPSLAQWIRSGYLKLEAPLEGRVRQKLHSLFLYSGIPKTNSLDFLPTPDWKLAQTDHNQSGKMIYYESVRGCPYRCNFCNYPFLFDDTKFRYKSAQKMASDWEYYVSELGVEYITCLDSLFTMPKRRLIEFCEELIHRKIKVSWQCYARADDLTDESIVKLMKDAGAHQVQIGVESGDPVLLQNMNKACTVESNAQALVNCRKYGLTTLISLIVGFPGENQTSLENTYQFIKATPPDFYFLATFSTRVAGVPLLEAKNKKRFGLAVIDNLYSMATYWKHDTMSCGEVGNYVRELDQKIMENKVALNSALFFQGILSFQPSERERLLDFQAKVVKKHFLLDSVFNGLHKWVDRKLKQDLNLYFRRLKQVRISV